MQIISIVRVRNWFACKKTPSYMPSSDDTESKSSAAARKTSGNVANFPACSPRRRHNFSFTRKMC